MKYEISIGARFGRLTVIERGPKILRTGQKYSRPSWVCQCDCGTRVLRVKERLIPNVMSHCGCLRAEIARATTKKTHGAATGHTVTSEYQAWRGMKTRCFNPRHRQFMDYGGRGITVCERWKTSYQNFLADMGPKPSPKHSIDRIDNDGNYEPGNCRWATSSQQNYNKRNNLKHIRIISAFSGINFIAGNDNGAHQNH